MPVSDTISRIEWCKENKCLPYLMRDISCWDSNYSDFYIDIAAYCNQVHIFKTMTFDQFIYNRHTNQQRIDRSLNIYTNKYNNDIVLTKQYISSLDDILN